MSIGVYKITSPSGKIYIGQSINIEDRWLIYEKFPNSYKPQRKLYNSLKKYGYNNHIFETLEECPESYLDELETWWKLFYNSVEDGLNCNYWDGSPMRGRKFTQEHKDKISQSNKGRIFNEEHKQKISITNKGISRPNSGGKGKSKPHSQEHCIKISESLKGKPKSKESIEKRSKLMKGRRFQFKPVLQYDLNDNFIKEWESQIDAFRGLNLTNYDGISACCKGKIKYSGGFKWKYKN